VSINDVTVNEGTATGATATLTLSLSQAATTATTIAWSTVAGTASAGTDYAGSSGTVTFAAGATTAQIAIAIVGDATFEPNELFYVVLSSPSGLTIGDDAGQVTILNDDSVTTPSVTVNATDASGAETAADPIVFTFTRSGSTSSSLAVNVAWSGTATAADHTVSVSGGTLSGSVLTFAAGSVTVTVTVTPIDDTAVEGSETVTLSAVAGSGYVLGSPSSASGSIADNDTVAPPAVSVTSTDATGSETPTDVITFNVTRTGSTATTLAANLTWGGTASSGDYTVSVAGGSLAGSVLTIAAGSSSATVTLTPIDDTAVEGSETVLLTVAGGSGYTVGSPASQSGTIADNDTAALPSLSIQATASITEGGSMTTTVTLTVTLTAASTQTVTVGYATANGTATAGSDYVAKTGALTFAPGVLTQTISVTVNGDGTAEPNETFTVTLSSPTNATVASAVGTVTIVNDDGAVAPAAALVGSVPLAGSTATAVGDFTALVAVESSGPAIGSTRVTSVGPLEPSAALPGTRVVSPGPKAWSAPAVTGPRAQVGLTPPAPVGLDLMALLRTAMALTLLVILARGLGPVLTTRTPTMGLRPIH
jgi:hypothetical protein